MMIFNFKNYKKHTTLEKSDSPIPTSYYQHKTSAFEDLSLVYIENKEEREPAV